MSGNCSEDDSRTFAGTFVAIMHVVTVKYAQPGMSYLQAAIRGEYTSDAEIHVAWVQ
jgi:hypothetical protein